MKITNLKICKLNVYFLFLLFSFALQFQTHTFANSNLAKVSLLKKVVYDPKGQEVYKANFFIGDVNEYKTKSVSKSDSFNKNTYGYNYYADYNQKEIIKSEVSRLPENMPINLIGHGLGGATAA